MPLLKDKNIDKFCKVGASNVWTKNGVELPYPPGHPPQTKETAAGSRGTTGQTVKATGENLQLANENIKCKSINSAAKTELRSLGDPMNELVDVVAACNVTCKTIPDVGNDTYTCTATNAGHCKYTRDLDFELIEGEFENDPVEWVAKMTVSVQGGDVPNGTTWNPKLTMKFMGSDEADEVVVTLQWDGNADKWALEYDHTTETGEVGNKINLLVAPNTVKEFIVHLVATEVDAVTMNGSINDEALQTGVASIAMGPAEAERNLSSYIRGVVLYSGVVRDN